MALFRVSNERAQFDAAGNETSDQYGAGIRFTQGGNARVTTASPTNYNQGIPMSSTGQVAIVDATAGLPAGTIFHNGLPISGDKVCVSRNATAMVSNGLPFDSAGAVAADVNLDLNFIGTDTLNSSITFTRASTGTYFNSAGVLTSAAIDAPRFDYNPATLAARGLLIEEQRTNSIRNNTMQGAVAGTPGTLPTNWNVFTSLTGLTREVVGTGTENGITYLDIRVSGTPSGAGPYLVFFESGVQIAAISGQTWTVTSYFKLQAGSLSGITSVRLYLQENNASGAYLTEQNFAVTNPTNAALNTQRGSGTRTLNQATTAFLLPGFNLLLTGAAIDITLRIGLPQLEQGAFATSVIPTTTTALTRSADVASVNTLSPWYNATEGTLYGEITDAAITVSGVSRRIANINDGTEADRITIGWAGATSVAAAFVTDNSVSQASFTSPSGAYPFPTKVALTYKAADFQAAVNGSAFAAVSSGTVPTVNRMTIGDVVTGGTGAQNLNGHVRRITYYPRRLSQAELTAITA